MQIAKLLFMKVKNFYLISIFFVLVTSCTRTFSVFTFSLFVSLRGRAYFMFAPYNNSIKNTFFCSNWCALL